MVGLSPLYGVRVLCRLVRHQGDVRVRGDDLEHDVEVGLSAAGVQGIECVLGVGAIEAFGLRQIGEQVLPRGVDAECGAAGGEVGPDERYRGSAVECAVAAVEQVVEGIQAGPERR